jgi:hypothetical protein
VKLVKRPARKQGKKRIPAKTIEKKATSFFTYFDQYEFDQEDPETNELIMAGMDPL